VSFISIITQFPGDFPWRQKMEKKPRNKTVSVTEAATMLSILDVYISYLVRQGKLVAVKQDGELLISSDSVANLRKLWRKS
jgi:hypothetical protein